MPLAPVPMPGVDFDASSLAGDVFACANNVFPTPEGADGLLFRYYVESVGLPWIGPTCLDGEGCQEPLSAQTPGDIVHFQFAFATGCVSISGWSATYDVEVSP